MEIYRKDCKPKDDLSRCFSFPNQVAELSDDIIDDLKMRSALKRFCLRLIEPCVKSVIGVEIHGIDFHYILKKEKS